MPAFSYLIEMFGGSIPDGLPLDETLEYLDLFSDQWDYRQRGKNEGAVVEQTQDSGGCARWEIRKGLFAASEEKRICDLVAQLGLVGERSPRQTYFDYLIVIGTARFSNLLRVRYAAELMSTKNIDIGHIILAAAARAVLDSERDATNTYAPYATKEFDLLLHAAECVFDLDVSFGDKNCHLAGNQNANWSVWEFGTESNRFGIPLTVLEVPSPAPDTRRATSADTFSFLVKTMKIRELSRCLLVTGQPFVVYQHYEAARTIALPHRVRLDSVGFGIHRYDGLGAMDEQHAAKLLQEVRSTIRAARFLIRNRNYVPAS